MKKTLGIIVLGLLLGGNAYAEEMTVKSLLDEGYKITKEEYFIKNYEYKIERVN